MSPSQEVSQKHRSRTLYRIQVKTKTDLKIVSKVIGSIPYSNHNIKITIKASEKPCFPPSNLQENMLLKEEVLNDLRKLLRYGISSIVNISVA